MYVIKRTEETDDILLLFGQLLTFSKLLPPHVDYQRSKVLGKSYFKTFAF